jgi:hypothetical protein
MGLDKKMLMKISTLILAFLFVIIFLLFLFGFRIGEIGGPFVHLVQNIMKFFEGIV